MEQLGGSGKIKKAPKVCFLIIYLYKIKDKHNVHDKLDYSSNTDIDNISFPRMIRGKQDGINRTNDS